MDLGGGKITPPDTEKNACAKAEKTSSRIKDLFKKQDQKQFKEKEKKKNFPLKLTTTTKR